MCSTGGAIGIPKWAEAPLTPAPLATFTPSPATSKLIQNVCAKTISSGETFSVTKSPMLCPEGKNYLFTIKPYFWETQPGSGCWERRDGQRNPLCDKPEGQKQLQSLALAVRPLAWGWAYNQDKDALAAAENLLKVFFLDEETRMMPETLYAQCNLGKKPLQGDKLFVVATRHLVLVDQAVALLPSSPVVDGVKAWIQAQLAWMDSGEQGAAARGSGNNVEIWYHALYASHLAALDATKAQAYAVEHLAAYITKSPAELMAPELERTRPRHYVLFVVEPLFLLTRIAAGNTGVLPELTNALGAILEFARTVPAGAIEAESDNDLRHGIRLSWFERMLAHWAPAGGQTGDEPDGSGWEGGWNQPSRLAWAMI